MLIFSGRFGTFGLLGDHKKVFHPQEEEDAPPSQPQPSDLVLFSVAKEGEQDVYRCTQCHFSHKDELVMCRHISVSTSVINQ